jgi:micrococcal nuclease
MVTRIIFFWLLLTGIAYSQLPEGIYPVQKVVDGDTINVLVEGKPFPVRLIGVDCPEIAKGKKPAQPLAYAAYSFTNNLIIASNGTVRLKHDGSKKDRYGRTLAMVYVQLPKEEVWLNKALVENGWAKVQTQYSFSKAAKIELMETEQKAKRNRFGIHKR